MVSTGSRVRPRAALALRRYWLLYAMLLPAAVYLFIFCYLPMYGIIIAFQDFQPVNGFWGSPFVGLDWFRMIFTMPDFMSIIQNTLYLAVGKIFFGQLASILFALLLNEVRHLAFKRTIQTLVYIPYFLSWVIISGMVIDLFSTEGPINQLIQVLGGQKTFFLGSNRHFRPVMILTDVWKNFGWGSILYLAALTAIDPQLYESAVMDGATRLRQTWHVTLPGILPTIVLLSCLNLGNVLNAGFEQILLLQNPAVYATGDIIDTFVYRSGLVDAQFSLSAAFGLMKSAVGMVLIVCSYTLAYRFSDYRIF